MIRTCINAFRELKTQIHWHRRWSEIGDHIRRYRAAADKKAFYRVWWEVLRAALKYRTVPDQYFACRYYHPGVSMAQVLDCVPSYTMHRKWQDRVNDMASGDHRLLYNKIFFHVYMEHAGLPITEPLLYLMNGTWYVPSLKMISPEQALATILASGTDRIFCKAATSNQGLNISCFIHDGNDGEYHADTEVLDRRYLDRLAGSGRYVLEKGLIQHPDMARLNSSTVNTFRVVTQFVPGEGANVLFAYLRIGRPGSIVDNIHAGGWYVVVDADTGIPEDHGYDRWNIPITRHPDTGAAISALTFPFYGEVAELAKQAACLFPTTPSIGWDIAYTEHGPVIIEGNLRWSHEMYQVAKGGFAPVARREWGLG